MLIERLTQAIVELTNVHGNKDKAVAILEDALAEALKQYEHERQLKKAFIRTARVMG